MIGALVRVFRDLLDSLRNLSFRWLFGGMLSIYAVGGVNAALALYMLNYFWEVGAAGTMLVVVGAPVGAMLGAFLAPVVFDRWSKRAGLIVGTLGWAFWQTLPVALRLLGYFPENGDAVLLPLLVGMQVVQGVCVAQADVAGFGFVSVWCFSRYRLTRQRHGDILRVLARRRAGAGGVLHTAPPPEGAA